MKNVGYKEFFTVSGTIAGISENVIPSLKETERAGSFAVSLKVKNEISGPRIAFCGFPVECGRIITVKATAVSLYRVAASAVMYFSAVVSGLVKPAISAIKRVKNTFRRVPRACMVKKVVLLSCAGGLRL